MGKLKKGQKRKSVICHRKGNRFNWIIGHGRFLICLIPNRTFVLFRCCPLSVLLKNTWVRWVFPRMRFVEKMSLRKEEQSWKIDSHHIAVCYWIKSQFFANNCYLPPLLSWPFPVTHNKYLFVIHSPKLSVPKITTNVFLAESVDFAHLNWF